VEELKIICRFATYYDRLLRPEKDPKFNKALTRLNTLEYSTTFPFLLKAYDALESNVISTQQFQELLEVLENFMIRRWLVGEPTNYLNRVFPTLWKDIDVSNFSTSLRQLLATKSYPNDQVVEQKILERKLYSSGAQDRLYLLFETIERQLWSGSGGFASLNANATIEHIMPQSIANKIAWQQELGDNWQQVHDKYLDTLGNLTLVTQEWNSVLSNRAFVGNPPYTEQDGMSGKRLLFTRHAYRLNNHYFVDILKWDETAIIDRAKYLSEKILEIWPALAVTKPNTVQYGYPERLLLADTQHPVKSWRDVTTVTMDYLISKGKFEILKQTSPLNFQVHNQVKLDSKSWRPLSNGWMVYVNLSIKSACTFYEKMLTTSGVSLSDWELVVKENGSISPIPITLPLE